MNDSGILSYDDARRWLAAHPTKDVSLRKLRRQALRVDPASLPVMVEILAHGTDDEILGAFNVLYQHGARVVREGDSPATCRYHVTFADGSGQSVRPDNLSDEDFEDDRPPA